MSFEKDQIWPPLLPVSLSYMRHLITKLLVVRKFFREIFLWLYQPRGNVRKLYWMEFLFREVIFGVKLWRIIFDTLSYDNSMRKFDGLGISISHWRDFTITLLFNFLFHSHFYYAWRIIWILEGGHIKRILLFLWRIFFMCLNFSTFMDFVEKFITLCDVFHGSERKSGSGCFTHGRLGWFDLFFMWIYGLLKFFWHILWWQFWWFANLLIKLKLLKFLIAS